MERSNECSICRIELSTTEENRRMCSNCTTRLYTRANRDLDVQQRLAVREPLTEQRALGSQTSEDVEIQIPARDPSVDNILRGLSFGEQVSSTRGITLNAAFRLPETLVPTRQVVSRNGETNPLYEELQQSRSSNEQLPRTYAMCQATATSTSGASDRYPRPRQPAPPDSDVRYPIQETSQQSQEHGQHPPSIATEHVCTCPQCQPTSHFQYGQP